MSTYTITATVRRAQGATKTIEWVFDGSRGRGTRAWNAWSRMTASGRTLDTEEPFMCAAVLRDGVIVESIGM
jgi:hypothetical protein